MYDKVRFLPSAISVAFLVIPSLIGNVLYAQQSNLIVPEIKEISWGLYVDDPVNACWLMSTPIPDRSKHIRDGTPRRVNRGAKNEKFPTAMLVGLDRSKDNVKPFVTFTGGSYKFSLEEKHKTKFTLTVDGQKVFPMFPTIDPDGTYGARGWSYTYADKDAGAIEALRVGKEAKIVSVSSRGTVSTDFFSLIGFTAALEDMLKRCTLN